MAGRVLGASALLACLVALGCGPGARATACGPGTVEADGVCRVVESDAATSAPPDAGPSPTGDGGMVALPEGVFDLTGVEATLPYDDLERLAPIIEGADIVALGESVHTSEGYSQTKHRLFRYLVEARGFRAYAFESPWTDAEAVGAYVETCSGSARTAVQAGLFGVWHSQSVVDLVEWMCEWNRGHPDDKVSFFGFDVQQPWDDGRELRAYLERVSPEQAAALVAPFDACDGATAVTQAAYYAAWTDSVDIGSEQNARCMTGLDAIDAHLSAERARIVAASSETDFALAQLRVAGLRAWQGEIFHSEYNVAPGALDVPASFEARDRGMAYAFETLRATRHGDARTVIWAHNTHIAARQDEIDGYYGGARSMGTFLAERLGTRYAPIGIVGYEVSINWPGVGEGPLPVPTALDAVEVELHALGRPYLLVDLARNALFGPDERHELQGDRMVPADQFRGLVFLDVSPPMDSISW